MWDSINNGHVMPEEEYAPSENQGGEDLPKSSAPCSSKEQRSALSSRPTRRSSAWGRHFLSACCIVLRGFSSLDDSHEEGGQLTRALASAGAVVQLSLNGATHAVVHARAPAELVQEARAANLRCVTPDWVWECVEAGTQLPESLYDRFQSVKLPSRPPGLRVLLASSLNRDERDEARQVATDAGLAIVRDRSDADIIVTAHFSGTGNPREVTLLWLKRCAGDGVVHDPGACGAFRPAPQASTDEINAVRMEFSKLVVCATGYTRLLRDGAAEACKVLGATYEEVLYRSGQLAATHLLCRQADARNPKCRAARSVGAHLVTMEWLNACLFSLKRLDESRFPPDSSLACPADAECDAGPSQPPPIQTDSSTLSPGGRKNKEPEKSKEDPAAESDPLLREIHKLWGSLAQEPMESQGPPAHGASPPKPPIPAATRAMHDNTGGNRKRNYRGERNGVPEDEALLSQMAESQLPPQVGYAYGNDSLPTTGQRMRPGATSTVNGEQQSRTEAVENLFSGGTKWSKAPRTEEG